MSADAQSAPAESADSAVLLEVGDDGVAVLTLNRPERRNGWNPTMEARYFALLDEADRDPRVRVAILTGAGPTFCPGMDTARLDEIAGRPLDMTGRRSPIRAWAFRKPLIGAVNGACAGMGLVQALLCDVRFAARGARFTTSFARRGLVAEYGISWLLPRIVGTEHAADLLLSGRVIEAEEARSIGLVSRVVEEDGLLAAAREYARDIAANCSPASLAMIRHQLHTDLQGSLDDAVWGAYRAMSQAVLAPDFREGLDSFAQRRPPSFAPLPDDYDPPAVTGRPVPELDIDPAAIMREAYRSREV